MKIRIILLVLAAFITINAQAQREFKSPRVILGLSAAYENVNVWGNVSGSKYVANSPKENLCYGISVEMQLSKHSGFESGLYYRQLHFADGYQFVPNDGSKNADWRDSYLSIPVRYKFYSNVVNFSTGVDVGFNLQGNRDISASVPVEFAFMFNLSKSINLTDNLILEPFAKAGIGKFMWIGAGIGVKYSF